MLSILTVLITSTIVKSTLPLVEICLAELSIFHISKADVFICSYNIMLFRNLCKVEIFFVII